MIWVYSPGIEGGAENQARRIATELVHRGHHCEVWTAWQESHWAREEILEGILIRRFGRHVPLIAPALGRYGPLKFWLNLPQMWLARASFIADVREYVKKVELPDIFHLHEPSWLGGFAEEIGRPSNIPVLCQEATFPTLQPLGYDVPKRKHLERLKKDAWFIAMLPYMADDMFEKGIPPHRIFRLPSGINVPGDISDVAKSKDVLHVGNFSQGISLKAFDVLLDAWVYVNRDCPEAKLTFVGGGNPSPWIHRARKNGIVDSVIFAGRVPQTEPFYRQAGLFTLPSRAEGMSNALLEAMSWGLPCVVSDIPGNRAVIDHEVNGLIVPVNNATALAESILRLLKNPSLRSSLGSNARKKAESEYDIHRVTDRLIDIYKVILDKHSVVAIKRKLD
jgi:glycosyltransferase involved in cell wall biosynthesis